MRAYLLALLIVFPSLGLADEATFAEQSGTRGILYAVHEKGSASPTLYVFGTIHVGKVDVTPFSHAVLGALSGTKRLALEADVTRAMEAAALMMKLGMLPTGDTLDKHLPPKVASDLHVVIARQKLDEHAIESTRPWAAAAMLELGAAAATGLDGNFAADAFLGAWATEHKVPIVELEGFEYQLRIMSDVPEADQVEMVSDMVKELGKPDPSRSMKVLYDAWRTGNEKTLEAELKKDGARSAAAKRFQKTLLDDRNIGMAEKAEGLLQQTGDTFLAVGAAHLVGKKGILALLRSRGYEITPVK